MNSGPSFFVLLEPDSTLHVVKSLALPKLESTTITSGPEGVPAVILICLSKLSEGEVPTAGSAQLVLVPHHRDIPC